MALISVASRFALGLVFLAAGLWKLGVREAFVRVVVNFRLLPTSVSTIVGRALPPLEVACGSLLLIGLFQREVALLLGGMLVCFSTAVGINLARGLRLECGCFGPGLRTTITWVTVVRNAVLATMSGFVAARPEPILALDAATSRTGGTVVSTADAWAAFIAVSACLLVAVLLPEGRKALRLASADERKTA